MDKLAYEKKIMCSEQIYGDVSMYLQIIGKLLYCMKESNKINNHDCEFFQLRFRPAQFLEGGHDLCMELRWGHKDLIKKIPGIDNKPE